MYRELERITPFDFFVSQGGYNEGGVTASAGTHDREAVDISASLLTPDQRWTVCANGRRIGWAMWIRTPDQGFPWHLHGVPINGDLSISARAQVVQYLNHQNGLAGGGPDDGPPGYYDMTWEKYQASSAYRPPIEEDDMTPEQASMLAGMDQRIKDLHTAMSDIKAGNAGAEPFRPFFRRAAKDGTFDVVSAEGNRGLGAKLDKILAKLGIS
jgi:hypothetical protein